MNDRENMARFNEEAYLEANPDVANTGCSALGHYLSFGRDEGRRPRLWKDRNLGTAYIEGTAPQEVADIFKGEWSSLLPAHLGITTEPGHARVFEDPRIGWMNKALGPIRGMSVLEIGPLEAGHTYTMHNLGASEITSVEMNPRAFLKCLCIKELLGLDRARFILGDAISFLKTDRVPMFDLIVASGVLYHLSDPLSLLEAVAGNAKRLFVWTHYFDADIMAQRDDRELFADPEDMGEGLRGSRRMYPSEALSWAGFSGGRDSYAVWLTKRSIIAFLESKGFSIMIGFDDMTHANGPCMALCAVR